MSTQHHYVKILPRYYKDVESGIKAFEVRLNDRDYKIGNILHLQEFCDGEYTGREIQKEICYMIDEPEYCKEGFVVLGLKDFIPSSSISSNDILFLSSVFQVLGVVGEVRFDGNSVTLGYVTKHGSVCAHFSIDTMRKYYNRVSAFLSEVL